MPLARLRQVAALVLVTVVGTFGVAVPSASNEALPPSMMTADAGESPTPTVEPSSPPPAAPTPEPTPTPDPTPTQEPTPSEQPAPPSPTPEQRSALTDIVDPASGDLIALAAGDPFGNLESLAAGSGRVTASGWALDPDTTDPIIVQMYVDYATNTMTWANLPRPDVDAAFGLGPDHGFTLSMTVAPGTHTVCVFAVNTGPGTSTAVGCRTLTVLTSNPMGNIDSLTIASGTVTASGWALDPDTTDPIIVQMYVDYATNTMTWANLPRPDVDAAFGLGPEHGFTLSMTVAPGTHTVCVFAVNTGPGTSTAVGCRTITIGHDCSALKCVALTFDDGPGPYTSRLLDILESTGAEATFFLVGERISGYPTVVRRMRSLGMEVANHSWNHADLTTLSSTEIASQLSRTSATIESTIGKRPTLMRPPYGARNSTVDSVSRQQGLAVILWSLDTLDWRYLDPVRTRSVVVNGAVDGTIALMHDIHSTTVDAVPGIISDLRARGFTLVTVSEILGSPVPGVVYSHG